MTYSASQEALEALTKVLNVRIEMAQKEINKFTQDMVKNPVYAFQWSQGAMEAAAKQQVTIILRDEVAYYVDKGDSDKEVLEALLGDYRYQAKVLSQRTPSSTSTQSNCMDNYKREALWGLVDDIDSALRFSK